MMIPSLLLKKLYTLRSLKNTDEGAQFALKNRLSDAELVGVLRIAINGKPMSLDQVRLDLADGRVLKPAEVDPKHPIPFPLRSIVTIQTGAPELPTGKHEIEMAFDTRPFGKLQFKVEDAIAAEVEKG